MGAFIAKQPNGLYCRFSSVVDCPTHWNMTEEEYIEWCANKARILARRELNNELQPFQKVINDYISNNMPEEEFKKFLEAVGYKVKED